MGDLRDQLKKAKLLDKKRARQLAHEERVERTELGREGLEDQARERQEELSRTLEAERDSTRRAQGERDREREAQIERAACEAILTSEVRSPRGRGQRFYFATADGSLPFLECDQQESFQLGNGAFAIVRRGPAASHDYGLLPAEYLKRVHGTVPEAVVWVPGGNR